MRRPRRKSAPQKAVELILVGRDVSTGWAKWIALRCDGQLLCGDEEVPAGIERPLAAAMTRFSVDDVKEFAPEDLEDAQRYMRKINAKAAWL